MQVSIETDQHQPDVIVFKLRGDLDYASAALFRGAVTAGLTRAAFRTVIVDLADVSFLDSTGVGMLVVARRICGDLAISFAVRNASLFVARIFAVLGVCETLGVDAPPGVIEPRRRPRADERIALLA